MPSGQFRKVWKVVCILLLTHLVGVLSFLSPPIDRNARALLIKRSGRKLPDDPAALKQMVKEKETEIKYQKKMEATLRDMVESMRKDKDQVESMRKDKNQMVESMQLVVKLQDEQLSTANAEVLRVTGRFICRFVIEKLEPKYSGVRRREITAPRTRLWKDAFENHPDLLGMMRDIRRGLINCSSS